MLATAFAAVYARLLRGSLLDVLGEDYIRTARAKGLTERTRDPASTACAARSRRSSPCSGLDIGILLGGAILTESVFNIPGIGRLAYDAIVARRPADRAGNRALRRLLHHHHEPDRGHPLRLPRPAGAVLDVPLLEVRDLAVKFIDRRRRRARRRRRLLLGRRRPLARHRRRVRLGQERLEPDACSGSRAPRNAHVQRRGAVRGPRPARAVRGRAARGARRGDRDDLPGPALLAAPVLPRRRPARRGGARAPRRLQEGGARPGDRDAAARRHPGAALARGLLPARVLRRHAPARDDRDGADQRAQAADRRRADDRARRDRAGADPRADRAAAVRDRHRRDHDHPRPRRRRGGDATRSRSCTPAGSSSARRRASCSRAPQHPVHVGPAALDPAAGRAARRGARADRGPPAVADQPPERAARSTRAARSCARRTSGSTRSSSPSRAAPDHDVACLLPPQTRDELWQRLRAGEQPDRARAAVPMGDAPQ